METTSKFNINTLRSLDSSTFRNVFRRIKFVPASSYLYPKIKIREERRGRDKHNIHTINNISFTDTKS